MTTKITYADLDADLRARITGDSTVDSYGAVGDGITNDKVAEIKLRYPWQGLRRAGVVR